MAVIKPIWQTVWPPKVINPANDYEERIARLQETSRTKWRRNDWRSWAEFLECHGGLLADELNKVRELAYDLNKLVPQPTKTGPKPKPQPLTIAAGPLGLVWIPLPRMKKAPGRPVDQAAADALETLRAAVELRMTANGQSRAAVLREMLREEHPRWHSTRLAKEARAISRKLSRPVKTAR